MSFEKILTSLSSFKYKANNVGLHRYKRGIGTWVGERQEKTGRFFGTTLAVLGLVGGPPWSQMGDIVCLDTEEIG